MTACPPYRDQCDLVYVPRTSTSLPTAEPGNGEQTPRVSQLAGVTAEDSDAVADALGAWMRCWAAALPAEQHAVEIPPVMSGRPSSYAELVASARPPSASWLRWTASGPEQDNTPAESDLAGALPTTHRMQRAAQGREARCARGHEG
ncbi:MAG: hypothetical protein ABR608_02910 [Pseudonocardiaceae bacterium]